MRRKCRLKKMGDRQVQDQARRQAPHVVKRGGAGQSSAGNTISATLSSHAASLSAMVGLIG